MEIMTNQSLPPYTLTREALRFGVVSSGACGEATLLVGLEGGAGGAS